ncbi:MAG: hypothetical protein JWM33_689 [Caulobacteraceae bacterium]|nr:hypothetical protein [Caulobacteraceae bacterium]
MTDAAFSPPAPHAVRRMVLDISPWGWVGLGVGIMAVLLMDLAWAVFPGRAAVAIMVSVSLPIGGLISAAKMPSWRLLPVTERQIAHGQWWRMVGGPVVLLALCLAGGIAWAAVTGMLHVALGEALTLFIRQAALASIVPVALMVGGPVHGRFGRLGGASLAMLLFGAAASAFPTFSWAPASFAALAVTALIATSALALARGRPVLPTWRMPAPRSGGTGWSPGGWLGFAAPVGAYTIAICVVAAVILGLDLLFSPRGPQRAGNPGIAAMLLAAPPMYCVMTFRDAGKVIGSLPIRPIVLCLGLQGLLLGSELALVALLLPNPEANPTLAWLALAMGMNACACAWMLRARDQVERSLIYAGGILALFIPSIDIEWPGKPDLSGLSLTIGFLLAVAGLYWTWLELARGHRVWRAIPKKPLTWRSRP